MSRLLKSIRSGFLMSSSAGTADAGGGSGGSGGAAAAAAAAAAAPPANAAFLASLPEPLRANDAFKDVGDVNTLAQRYVDARTFKIPEKYANENAFKDIKSLDGLADSYLNAQKMVGLDKARLAVLPADDKDTAGWDNLYKSLGRPDTADKYAIGKRADGKDYSPEDATFQKTLMPALHKAGITQRQLDALRPEWDGIMDGMRTAHETASKADMEKSAQALRTAWGGDYDGNLQIASEAITHYAKAAGIGDEGKELLAELDATKLGNNPALARVFAHMGKQLKEDGLLGKGDGGSAGAMSAEAAKKAIPEKEAAFRANAAFKDKNAPGRAEALAEITALYTTAYPPRPDAGVS